MSLPNSRSAPTPAPASDARSGSLAQRSLPELLSLAQRTSFTGTLTLEPPNARPSVLAFSGGAVHRASGSWESSALEWGVLSRLLPEDTIEFATQHAEAYAVEPFAAVERLRLLPPEGLRAAREALAVLGVKAMCDLPGETRYTFTRDVPGAERDLDPPIEPLGLIVACVQASSALERAARVLAAYEDVPLTVDLERSRRVLGTLSGPVRAVLERLLLAPESLRSLAARGLVARDELVACVHALWLTRLLVSPSLEGSANSPRPSTAPMPSVPPAGTAVPRRDSGFVRSDQASKERAMEIRVEEAWMLAQADPRRAERTRELVAKAVAVFPRNARLRYYLGCLHAQANLVQEAVRELERALELEPNDAEAERELERVLAGAGRSRSARFKRVVPPKND